VIDEKAGGATEFTVPLSKKLSRISHRQFTVQRVVMNQLNQFKRGFNAQEAMIYLGVKRKAFETHFRPFLNPIRFGTSLLFDKVDLDRIWDDHKRRNERLITEKGETSWAENKEVSIKTIKAGGVLTKYTEELDFESALQALQKQKAG